MLLARVAMVCGMGVAGFAQEVRTPSEVLASTLSDMRGIAESREGPGLFYFPVVATFDFLPRMQTPQDKASGARISAARLKHKTPGDAKKAYGKAKELVREGKSDRAVEQFLRAIALDPDYLEAHCDLGVLYVDLKRFHEAELEFRRAEELGPELTLVHSNLAWALLEQGEVQQAERSGRRALEVSNGNASAHLLLGSILGSIPAMRAEAVQHLEYAVRRIPQAEGLLRTLKGK